MVLRWPSPLEAVVLHGLLVEGSAYGLELVDMLGLKRGSVYVLLRRLEDKNLVMSQVEEGNGGGGGKNRRYYWATPLGEKFAGVLKAIGSQTAAT